MEREFLDVLDYELSVSEADLLDLHETLAVAHPSQPAPQLHPFFHTSALERAPRPQGVQMFRTRRIFDENSDEEEQEQDQESVYSDSFYGNEVPASAPRIHQALSSETETHVESRSTVPSSYPSSSEPPAKVISAFSYQPQMVSKPFTGKEGAQKSAISRALWLAGHQLISSLPTALSQVAVSS